jgi:hypothetical protein
MVASTSDWAACSGDIGNHKKPGGSDTLLPPRGGEDNVIYSYALGPHLAAQQPAFGAQGLAAQQPFFAEQEAAAQQPALAALAFFTFLGLAEQAPQLLRETGAQVAEAAVGATAIVRPPATANIVARLSDFDIFNSPWVYEIKRLLPLARNGQVTNADDLPETRPEDQEIFCHSALACAMNPGTSLFHLS